MVSMLTMSGDRLFHDCNKCRLGTLKTHRHQGLLTVKNYFMQNFSKMTKTAHYKLRPIIYVIYVHYNMKYIKLYKSEQI